jgi:AcrR family transcriptional regulator
MRETRKKQIIRISTELFAQKGYDSITTKEIASHCNISEAGLYKYFNSKEQLYDQVLKSVADKFEPGMLFEQLKDSKDIRQILQKIAFNIIDLYKRDSNAPRLLLYSSLNTHPRAKQVFVSVRMPYVNFLTNKLRRLISKGLIKPVKPEITARCFVGMVFDCSLNLNLWKGMSGRSYDPETIVKNNVGIYVDGLKTSSESRDKIK